jgi:hypothetical protein
MPLSSWLVDLRPSASARLNPTPSASFATTGLMSPSTKTSAPFGVQLELLMSLQPDSLAKTSVVLENKQVCQENDLVCSTKSSDWLGSFDLSSSSLRTLQILCLTKAGRRSRKCSSKLPAQGLMRNGQLYQRVMWEPATCGSECGSLPTPKAADGERGRDKARVRPDTKGRELATAVRDRMLPTPTTRDWKDGSQQACQNVKANGLLGREIHQAAGSIPTGEATYLNPSFVEEMMGFPVGWTALKL